MKAIFAVLTMLIPFTTGSQVSAQPKRVVEEFRMVQAYSIDGGTVRKEIHIPEGWVYWKHDLHQWTANPNVPNSNPQWSKTDGVIRDGQGRITTVFVEVSSVGRPFPWGPRNWIGVDLRVWMRRLPTATGVENPLPPQVHSEVNSLGIFRATLRR
jgi:hypothetical protein